MNNDYKKFKQLLEYFVAHLELQITNTTEAMINTSNLLKKKVASKGVGKAITET